MQSFEQEPITSKFVHRVGDTWKYCSKQGAHEGMVSQATSAACPTQVRMANHVTGNIGLDEGWIESEPDSQDV
jgi:hypothetical protein